MYVYDSAILVGIIKGVNQRAELYKIRREYYQNILFINELQRTCYGSVIEQISEMEEKMPLYCNASINESNQIALDNILKGDQQYRSDNE